jgi:Xaa-Pro aminopeptidase
MHLNGLMPELEEELKLRQWNVAKLLQEQGADAMIVTSNPGLYYLTGRVPDAYLYMTADGLCLLFLRRPHAWEGKSVVRIKHPAEIPGYLARLDLPLPRRLMLEEDLPHAEYQRILDVFPGVTPLPGVLRRARMIKTPFEQELMRRVGRWHTKAIQGVPALYRPGMTDVELEVEIDHHFRSLGHPGFFRIAGHRMQAVMGTILAGDNAAEPSPFDFALGGAGHADMPFSAGGRVIEEGTTVLVDESGSQFGYLTDMSRVFSVGKLPRTAYTMHDVALDIQAAFVANAQVGARCCDLYNQAVDIARRAGFEDNFMGLTQHAKFVGHSLGLEINEPPVIAPRDTTCLMPGMTIAYEPKFILPGVGAVGIENTFLITSDGPERLTPGDDAILPLG